MKTSFLGLGVMGFPMAGHLKKGGHEVTVYNRTQAKAQKWVETHGGRAAATPAEAAKGADIVFSCVGNDDDLRSIVQGVATLEVAGGCGIPLDLDTSCQELIENYIAGLRARIAQNDRR